MVSISAELGAADVEAKEKLSLEVWIQIQKCI